MRGPVLAALALCLAACTASGPVSLVSDQAALEINRAFEWSAPLPDGGGLLAEASSSNLTQINVTTWTQDDTGAQLPGRVETSVEVFDLGLPSRFLVASASPPPTMFAETDNADRRIFALVRCEEDLLQVYRLSAAGATRSGMTFDPEVTMLRLSDGDDLAEVLTRVIEAGALEYYSLSELPRPVRCSEVFVNAPE